jgi:hypothetical protein
MPGLVGRVRCMRGKEVLRHLTSEFEKSIRARTPNQKLTVAAMQTAVRKLAARRSYLAIRLKP